MNENTEYFIMHIILLGLITIAAGAGTVAFSIAWYNDTYEDKKDDERRKWRWAFAAVGCLLLFGGGLSWWIASGNQPWRHEYTSLHEIKEVTFPDGTHAQMFTCDGTHHNVTQMFGKVVDAKEWQIRRVRWSPLYLGLSWSSCQRCQRGDHYFLDHKEGKQPSVELEEKTPDNSK